MERCYTILECCGFILVATRYFSSLKIIKLALSHWQANTFLAKSSRFSMSHWPQAPAMARNHTSVLTRTPGPSGTPNTEQYGRGQGENTGRFRCPSWTSFVLRIGNVGWSRRRRRDRPFLLLKAWRYYQFSIEEMRDPELECRRDGRGLEGRSAYQEK